ncbi:sulfotransferase [Psychroserpens mesophilus]|uniref:sulfotransferase n=1 Tax=Psychroserpens mesophilus TaxID=325473 RepID=UPI003D6573D4
MINKVMDYKNRVLAIFKPKIFCISFQRTGTTSVGVFFKEHGYAVGSYGVSKKNDWTLSWFKGDYEKIFNSFDFKTNQVFEDDPWWCLSFYKVLFHRFPKAKFILLERDSDKWYDSMVNHSNGKILGNTYRHSKTYRRENEFYDANFNVDKLYSRDIDNLLLLTEDQREHYKNLYELRIREVKEFFNQFGSDRLFTSSLENPKKWNELGAFVGIKVAADYEVHANNTAARK